MKKLLVSAMLAAPSMLAMAQPAQAAITFYTDRTAFEAALGGVEIEDFADNFLVPNLSFTTTAGAVSGGGLFTDIALPGTTSTTFNFGTSVFGFGGNFDLPLSVAGTGLKFTIVPGGALATELANTYSGGFFGFISDAAFDSVLIEGGTQAGLLPFESYTLDNLTFDAAVPPPPPAVPEPATWLMLIAGFALAGATLRNNNASVRVRFN